MTHKVFLFGPWADAGLLAVVLAAPFELARATLEGHRLCNAPSRTMPMLLPCDTQRVAGVLLTVDDTQLARLNLHHAVFGAQPFEVTVESADSSVQALVYFPDKPEQSCRTQWCQEDWAARQAGAVTLASAEIMALADTHSSAALRARWPMALAHAASILRARAEDSPAALRRDWSREDISLAHHAQPYAWFFGVSEDDLRFTRFDGTLSPLVRRAGFVMSDAVTVLPYDPQRDAVLVIEQFRYGPYIRGVRNPWSLEPIAGRIDPFETPEDCALREAGEEARLTLAPDRLISVGNVYPSPGAVSEFLFQFVALCDLPEGSEGVAGLEDEAEDIRSHIIAFDHLMSLIARGEVQNGPLVLTAYWLGMHRDRLRVR